MKPFSREMRLLPRGVAPRPGGSPARRPLALALLGAALLGLTMPLGGCRPEDQETASLDPRGSNTRAALAPELAGALDSGSVAFREHRFEASLEHYERATVLAPDHAAGWFGVYMAHRAMEDLAAAEQAMAKVRELAPGATILHPDEDTLGGGAEP